MADFGTPVAGQNPPTSGLTTLESLMSLKRQQQQIQTGQFQQQSAQAESQLNQQQASQQAAASNYFQNTDLSQHVGPDGTLDLNSIMSDPKLRATGSAMPAITQQIMGIKNQQLEAKQQLASLNGTLRGQFSSAVGGLIDDPDVVAGNEAGRGKMLDAVNSWSQAGGPDAARVASIYSPVIKNAPAQRLGEVARNIQLQANSASELAGKTAPSEAMVQGPTGLQPVNVNALAPGGVGPNAAPIKQGISPQIITNPTTGGPAVVGPGTTPSPIGGSGTGPAAPGTGNSWQPPADLKNIQAQVDAARQAGDQVPVNRDINNRILKLADQTSTGPGSSTIHQIAAAAGLPSGSSYQEMSAFLDRQAALAQQGMGLPTTNAGLETAKQFTGNTQYDNQVIKDKTKFVDALNSATGAYRAGMDRVVGTGATPNYAAYQQYRSQWAQNFDPNVFAYENAFKRGDKPELAKIEADEGRKGMADLLQKRKTLMGLVNGQ